MTTQHAGSNLLVRDERIFDSDQLIRAVDDIMLQATDSNISLLRDTSAHIIQSGGKRIRPQMLLLTYAGLGGEDLDYALPVAASIELVHTASVVHDDINDHGLVRRGRPSINAVWGRTFALLTGDFLFTKVYQLMAEYDNVNSDFAVATTALVEGETLQASAVKDGNFSTDVYFRVIALKTAELFRAATKIGATLAGADKKTRDAMGEFGFNVGMAFQIVDDVLDLIGDSEQLGKTSGIDMQQGKGFASINGDADNGDPMAMIKNKALNGNTVDKAMNKANEYIEMALENIDVMPDSYAKDRLINITELVLDRSH